MDRKDGNSKIEALKQRGGLNPRAKDVKDEVFEKYDFFDPHDLVQVKYEMVRRVQRDGWSISQASKTFGFSRPSFYEIQSAFDKEGLPGLTPRRRGPKTAHKLSDNVMKFVKKAVGEDNTLRAPQIASLIEERFGLKVHPRSIERALAKKKKGQKGDGR
jgi:transposase